MPSARVVDLEHERDAAVGQSVDVPQLPGRAVPVERLLEELGDLRTQLAIGSGRSGRGALHVVVQVAPRAGDPPRPAGAESRRHQLPLQGLDAVDEAGQCGPHGFERDGLVALCRIEDDGLDGVLRLDGTFPRQEAVVLAR